MNIAVPIGAAISGAVLSTWFLVLRLKWEARAQQYALSDLTDTEFRGARIALVLICLITVPGAFFLSPTISSRPDARVVYAIIGIAWLVGGALMLYWHCTSAVRISGGEVEFRHGRKTVRFKLADIDRVKIEELWAVVWTKDKRRVDIPLQFSENAKLLAMLKCYRPRL